MKNSQIKCIVEGLNISFLHQIRDSEGEWKTEKELDFCSENLPAAMREHMEGYGLRALLQDRASDFRKHGESEYLKAISEYYDLFASGILKKAVVRKGGIDRALVQLIAELKSKPLVWAEAQLKAVPKEVKEALAEVHAERLKEIRAELATVVAEDGALADLL